jgi:ferredoxin
MVDFISIFIQDKAQTLRELKLPNDPSYSLMEMLRSSELPVLGTCDGMALCASCHIYIHSKHQLPPVNDEEQRLLDSLNNSHENSRLSCQLRIHESLHKLHIEIAPD